MPERSTLIDLKPGESARVTTVALDNGDGHRLLAMGITPGTIVRVERVAPLGDPIEIHVRGYRLMVRKSEAAGVAVAVDEVGARGR